MPAAGIETDVEAFWHTWSTSTKTSTDPSSSRCFELDALLAETVAEEDDS